jgi:hypothetical protein
MALLLKTNNAFKKIFIAPNSTIKVIVLNVKKAIILMKSKNVSNKLLHVSNMLQPLQLVFNALLVSRFSIMDSNAEDI